MNYDHSYRTPRLGLSQSQHGEDLWLDNFFAKKTGGYFVEVGAYDGVVLSNTYFFEKARDWTGILVEPDPENAERCRMRRPNAKTFQCAASRPGLESINFTKVKGGGVYSTSCLNDNHKIRLHDYGLEYISVTVPAKSLDLILAEAGATVDGIDLMTIDVEEAEMEVLGGFTLAQWKPKIVVIESNQAIRKPEIRDYFVRNGYAYLRSISINDLYVPVVFGRYFSFVVDQFRYRWVGRKQRPSIVVQARRFLDRYVFWRFNRKS